MTCSVALCRLSSPLVALSFAAAAVWAQDRRPAPPVIVVLPFTTESPPTDSVELPASATRMVQHLNRVLGGDTAVRWVEYRPLQRPRDPRTGEIVPARYAVVGAVRLAAGSDGVTDSVWIRVQLVAVETMDLLLRDSVKARLGGEAVRATRLAQRIVGTLREHARRRREGIGTPPGDSVPTAALTLVARATLSVDRGDTADAVALLKQALVLAPRWAVPCTMLWRLSPRERCR
jgi:hypothetical protein